jgi:hypothetical protein
MSTSDYPATDDQFTEHRLTTVEAASSGGWSMGLGDGGGFFCPQDSPVEPRPGMTARLYGKGLGYVVRGLFLDGHRVFYRTEAEQAEEDRRQAEDRDKERRYDFEKNRADLDRRFAALPEVFRRRIARFRAGCPSFRWEYEPYELFVCEQAVEIAKELDGGDPHVNRGAFEMFRSMTFEEQKARVPALSDDHSGNTFGCACALALAYLTNPESVAVMHGAMVPLVGCEAYGCTHGPAEATEIVP